MCKLETNHEQAVANNNEGVRTAAQLGNDAEVHFEQILKQQVKPRKKNCFVYGIE